MSRSDSSNDSLRFIKIILLTIVIGAIFVELANVVSSAESLSNFFFTVGIFLLGTGLLVGLVYIVIKLSGNKPSKVDIEEAEDIGNENDEGINKGKKKTT